jgi:hypothetical protein
MRRYISAAQANLLANRRATHPALAQPDRLTPPLFLRRSRQVPHVHVPHPEPTQQSTDGFKFSLAGSIGHSASCPTDKVRLKNFGCRDDSIISNALT